MRRRGAGDGLSRRDALGGLMALGPALGIPARSRPVAERSPSGLRLPAEAVDVVTLALDLERLQLAYYRAALVRDALLPRVGRRIVEAIAGHEAEHVELLNGVLGQRAVAARRYDFTAGGALDPLGSYPAFLELAQVLEDTVQRGYRGQIERLSGAPDLLTAVLRIHSVQARHAALVRRLRSRPGWVGSEPPGVGRPLAGAYAGTDRVERYGVDVTRVARVERRHAAAAFDDGLTEREVRGVVARFVR